MGPDLVNVVMSRSDSRPHVVVIAEGASVVTLLLPHDCQVGDVLNPWAFPRADGLTRVVAFGGRWERIDTGWKRRR